MSTYVSHHVAIWIDHQEAILVSFAGDHLDNEEDVFSSAGPHTHGGGRSQHHFESHRHEILKHFYDEVIHHLGSADEVLVLGPGQAKHDLRRRIEHHKSLKGKVSALINASRLTEAELISQAEAFFSSESDKSEENQVSADSESKEQIERRKK